MKRAVSTLVTALLVAAPLAAQSPLPAKAYSDRMAALPEIQRLAAIRRAILDNGQWCPRVTAAAYQQPIKNLQMWAAHCSYITPPQKTLAGTMPKSQADYGLFIGPDGSVQASECKEIVKVGWPACRPLPAGAGMAPAAVAKPKRR